MRLLFGIAKSNLVWLLVPILTPFLVGGVAAGDEAWVLTMVRGFQASALPFAEYARSGDGWYTVHHFLWFWLLFVTVHIAQLAQLSPLLTEAAISAQTVMAGLSAIILCYIFLVRRMNLSPALGLWTVLGFFAAGYGVFTFAMGGVVESYLALAMAMRLFLSEKPLDGRNAVILATVDAVMVGLKGYSLVFIAFTLPLVRGGRRERMTYLATLAILLLLLGASKLWLWNPYYAHALRNTGDPPVVSNFLAQLFSPWTGLLVCLPILWTLLWQDRSRRKSLLFKSLGLLACIGVFSLYIFFNGDIAGGRYIFPFLIAIIPDIAIAAQRMLRRFPKLAWLLPILTLAFLPVAGVRTPFVSNQSTLPKVGSCTPDHPAIRAWKTVAASLAGTEKIVICYDYRAYQMDTRDAASPRLGPWRIAYLLGGGFSSDYRARAHNAVQQRHDMWGDGIATRLQGIGLGNPFFWQFLGLVPAMVVLTLAVIAARSLARPGPL